MTMKRGSRSFGILLLVFVVWIVVFCLSTCYCWEEDVELEDSENVKTMSPFPSHSLRRPLVWQHNPILVNDKLVKLQGMETEERLSEVDLLFEEVEQLEEEPMFVVYVSSAKGNDSNDGSEFSPVETLSGAFSLINSKFNHSIFFLSQVTPPPMVFVLLSPGVYSGPLNQNITLPYYLSFNISGLSEDPDDTVLEGEGAAVPFFSSPGTGPSRIICRYLTFQNSSSSAIFFVPLTPSSSNVSIFLLHTKFFANNGSQYPTEYQYIQPWIGAALTVTARKVFISDSFFFNNGNSDYRNSRWTLMTVTLNAGVIVIHNCSFENNIGDYSGLKLIATTTTVQNTRFHNNSGVSVMGLSSNFRGVAIVRNCQFIGNPCSSNRIQLFFTHADFQDCLFSDQGVMTNHSFLVFHSGHRSVLQRCLFTNIQGGGITLSSYLSVHLLDSIYTNNSVGLIHHAVAQFNFTIEKCQFTWNQVTRPLLSFGGVLQVFDSIFENNHLRGTNLVTVTQGTIRGCTFQTNTSPLVNKGKVTYLIRLVGEITIWNCSFSHNSMFAVINLAEASLVTISGSSFVRNNNAIHGHFDDMFRRIVINDCDFVDNTDLYPIVIVAFSISINNCRFSASQSSADYIIVAVFDALHITVSNSVFFNYFVISIGQDLSPLTVSLTNTTFWNVLLLIDNSPNDVTITDCSFVFQGPPREERTIQFFRNPKSITWNGNIQLCRQPTNCSELELLLNNTGIPTKSNQLSPSGSLASSTVLQPLAITTSTSFGTKILSSPTFLCTNHNESVIAINITIVSNHPFVLNITNSDIQDSLLANKATTLFIPWNGTSPLYTLRLNQSIYFAIQPTEEYFTEEDLEYVNPWNVSQFDNTIIEVTYVQSTGYYLPHSTLSHSRVSLSSSIITLDVELYDEWGRASTRLRSYPRLESPELIEGYINITNQTTRTFWNAPSTSGRFLTLVPLYLDGQPLTAHVLSSWWVLGFVIGVASCAALYVFISRVRQYRARLLEKQQQIEEKDKEIQLMEEVWRIQPEEIEWAERIAAGEFGEVWRCEWRETTVAVKQLLRHWVEMDKESSEGGFEKEVKLLRSIRHPNIVLFYGAGVQSDGIPFLVTEYVARGSLYSLVVGETFSWIQKAKFLLGAAEGMKFLHSLEPPLIHRDLKPHNMLVTKQLRAKIADFGTAKLLANVTTTPPNRLTGDGSHSPSLGLTTHLGTPNYRAPELDDFMLLSQHPNYTGKEADVYSFGITMWTVATEREPFQDVPLNQLSERVGRGERPSLEGREWPEEWLEVMKSCWTDRMDIRPRFATVVVLLKSLILEFTDTDQ